MRDQSVQRVGRVVMFPVPRERWWRRTMRWIRYGAHHHAHVAPMDPLRVIPLQRR
jgi:hypothetical protein